MSRVYVVGSLRNPRVMDVASRIREAGHEVFEDWFAAGPTADDSWQDYEQQRGRSYVEALHAPAALHVFEFDLKWLQWADSVVAVMPAGKSAYGELCWARGAGKQTYALVEQEPERWDVMLRFAETIVSSLDELIQEMED